MIRVKLPISPHSADVSWGLQILITNCHISTERMPSVQLMTVVGYSSNITNGHVLTEDHMPCDPNHQHHNPYVHHCPPSTDTLFTLSF